MTSSPLFMGTSPGFITNVTAKSSESGCYEQILTLTTRGWLRLNVGRKGKWQYCHQTRSIELSLFCRDMTLWDPRSGLWSHPLPHSRQSSQLHFYHIMGYPHWTKRFCYQKNWKTPVLVQLSFSSINSFIQLASMETY